MTLDNVKSIIHQFDGVVIRSRFKIDTDFLKNGKRIKFITRVGSGLENIDIKYLKKGNRANFSTGREQQCCWRTFCLFNFKFTE